MSHSFTEHITYILFSGIKNRYYIGLGSSSNIGSVVKVGGLCKKFRQPKHEKKDTQKTP